MCPCHCFHRPRALELPSLGDEDQDVARERARVGSIPPHGHLLLLKDLTKVGVWGWALLQSQNP